MNLSVLVYQSVKTSVVLPILIQAGKYKFTLNSHGNSKVSKDPKKSEAEFKDEGD